MICSGKEKHSYPDNCRDKSVIYHSCGATPLNVLTFAHCIQTYANTDYGVLSRRIYGQISVRIALRSPFFQAYPTAFSPTAALFVESDREYFLSVNGLKYNYD